MERREKLTIVVFILAAMSLPFLYAWHTAAGAAITAIFGIAVFLLRAWSLWRR
jgi:hypothetical protein